MHLFFFAFSFVFYFKFGRAFLLRFQVERMFFFLLRFYKRVNTKFMLFFYAFVLLRLSFQVWPCFSFMLSSRKNVLLRFCKRVNTKLNVLLRICSFMFFFQVWPCFSFTLLFVPRQCLCSSSSRTVLPLDRRRTGPALVRTDPHRCCPLYRPPSCPCNSRPFAWRWAPPISRAIILATRRAPSTVSGVKKKTIKNSLKKKTLVFFAKKKKTIKNSLKKKTLVFFAKKKKKKKVHLCMAVSSANFKGYHPRYKEGPFYGEWR